MGVFEDGLLWQSGQLGWEKRGCPGVPVMEREVRPDPTFAERTLLVGQKVGPSPGSEPSRGTREVRGEPSLGQSPGADREKLRSAETFAGIKKIILPSPNPGEPSGRRRRQAGNARGRVRTHRRENAGRGRARAPAPYSPCRTR